ncbi:MAG: ribulose-phosphate 3-epimerase [Planctomycetaceae bacterium]
MSRRLPANVPVVAPSMLKCDFARLDQEVVRLTEAGARVLHWDVMDGHFVPNLSYGAMVIEAVRGQTDLVFDAHLMVSEPGRYLQSYLDAGCDYITVHAEAVRDPRPLLRDIRQAGRGAGLAINPGTPVSRIADLLEQCDLVLLMSVEPGFGGQKFQPAAVEKLRELKGRLPPGCLLSVDGGIGPATIAATAAAGASLFVAGSAIFDHEDYRQALRSLQGLAEGAAVSARSA